MPLSRQPAAMPTLSPAHLALPHPLLPLASYTSSLAPSPGLPDALNPILCQSQPMALLSSARIPQQSADAKQKLAARAERVGHGHCKSYPRGHLCHLPGLLGQTLAMNIRLSTQFHRGCSSVVCISRLGEPDEEEESENKQLLQMDEFQVQGQDSLD